ncbi:ATPase PAAT-like [Falco naumanni]|uniref:ATPase PAAT-like n=1 Tax=Falco naumanni TaxID=148594 RepID=UPI001ADEA9C6|nr:ATPase PAAT-like [Falco naumanni]
MRSPAARHPGAGAFRPPRPRPARFRPRRSDGEWLRGGAGVRAVLCGGGVLLVLRAAGQPGPGALPAAGGGEASTEAVVVERRAGGEAPCVLHLECRPGGAAEMVSVGILSEARNMEVYVGEEYCGTGRGQSLGAARTAGETDKVTLYKKYLKFECPAASCRIKLLSIGSSIDLDRVQTIMESMGSKLSPGAQQLMDMVRCQQKVSCCAFFHKHK